MSTLPRLLVISYNMFSDCDNMGKTLSVFSFWDRDKLAQISFCQELPSNDICNRFYRVTDSDVAKSIVKRNKCGRRLSLADKVVNTAENRENLGSVAGKMRSLLKKGSPFGFIARNTIWKLGTPITKELYDWIDEFNPECVFYASGAYSFSEKFVMRICRDKNIPLVTYCCDDFYIGRRSGILLDFVKRDLIANARKTIAYSSSVLTICDKMRDDYAEFFGSNNLVTLHTSKTKSDRLHIEKKNSISFLGNLSIGRYKEIVRIGRALRSLDFEGKPEYIDVYSASFQPEILAEMTEENGICFHGKISASEVNKVIAESIAVIHCESFDSLNTEKTRYSVSTKIADSLASGTCIFAFGPNNVASIEYLLNNKAAIVATKEDELKTKLIRLFSDREYVEQTVQNALALAEKNHSAEKNEELLREVITAAAESREKKI